MRIAYLINQYPKVSHSFIRREIEALERLGFEVVRIALRGWDSDLVDEADVRERKNTRYVLHGNRPSLLTATLQALVTRPRRFARALATAWRIGRRSERPRLVHLIYLAEASLITRWLHDGRLQHLHAHFGTNSAEIAMLAHQLGGPPWSLTVHGPEEFDKADGIGLSEILTRCNFAVAISSFGRSQLFRRLSHQHWPKVHVVHCGLEPASFVCADDGVSPPKRLVCVGRLCEQKGQMLLIEAARRLFDRGVIFDLVLAGDGELRSAIEALIEDHNLGSRIKITGWISNAQVRTELLGARALVLPSFAEGLPVVLMEAMALRRPVISTFVAGIPELVEHNKHGWLVPPGDLDALVDAMQACLEASDQTLVEMGNAGHARVLERHDIDSEALKLAALFGASISSRLAEATVSPQTVTLAAREPALSIPSGPRP